MVNSVGSYHQQLRRRPHSIGVALHARAGSRGVGRCGWQRGRNIWALRLRTASPTSWCGWVSLALLSFPGFYLGVLVVFLIALPLHLPTNGAAPFSDIGQNLYRLMLPALSLGLIGVAFQSRVPGQSC